MMRRQILLLQVCLAAITACSPVEHEETNPFIIFKTGTGYVKDGSYVSPGGMMTFGISATGGGPTITNLVIRRVSDGEVKIEKDCGLWKPHGGLDTTFSYSRGYAEVEHWVFFIMNANRDTASVSLTVNKGSGSAWGDINYFHSVTVGLQKNSVYPHYLDLTTGLTYSSGTVSGHEPEIDLAAFWYLSSGKSSPTLSCPAYNAVLTYYPEFASWSLRNQTLYDYYTSDYDLVTVGQFDSATNDSLLVNAYRPQSTSGQSKFAYTGKVVPFRTSDGKYGMLKIIRADETEDGSVEMAIKIQK